jgi:hypothetical protein
MYSLLWGFIKDHVYQPPLPTHLQELKGAITAATTTVTSDMLQRVWQEIVTEMSAT